MTEKTNFSERAVPFGILGHMSTHPWLLIAWATKLCTGTPFIIITALAGFVSKHLTSKKYHITVTFTGHS
jgi:hypothetical protein